METIERSTAVYYKTIAVAFMLGAILPSIVCGLIAGLAIGLMP